MKNLLNSIINKTIKVAQQRAPLYNDGYENLIIQSLQKLQRQDWVIEKSELIKSTYIFHLKTNKKNEYLYLVKYTSKWEKGKITWKLVTDDMRNKGVKAILNQCPLLKKMEKNFK